MSARTNRDLKERLLAKIATGASADGSAQSLDFLHAGFHRKVLRNPDGPEAVARIEALEAALREIEAEAFSSINSALVYVDKIRRIAATALQSGEAR